MFNTNIALSKKDIYLRWFKWSPSIWIALFSILPIILSQLSQRLFPVVDNHYLSTLGTQALLIHNIQYSLICLGQYIGSATATSCLVFWKRQEYAGKQKSIFLAHILFCLTSVFLCSIIASYYTKPILTHFSVHQSYFHLAKIYFHIGLFNMILQAIYFALSGMLIATGQEKLGLILAFILLGLNILGDSIATHFLFSGVMTPSHVFPAMLTIGLSVSGFLIFINCIMVYYILLRADYWGIPNIKEIFKIWRNELLGALMSGIYPIIYTFQLAMVKSSSSLLISYQLVLQFSSLICIPLMAVMQIALRDAAAEQPYTFSTSAPLWWSKLLYLGLLPTQILLILSMIFPDFSMKLVFGYTTPPDHQAFILLFLLATMIGQIGNALTVPIRARKDSHLVTTSYFIADVIFMLGGMQFIIFINHATPATTGLITLLYVTAYVLINSYFLLRKK